MTRIEKGVRHEGYRNPRNRQVPRRKGYKTAAADPSARAAEDYEIDLQEFCGWIIAKADALDFKVGSRGWCYILENEGIIAKGEFDRTQRLITDCRNVRLLRGSLGRRLLGEQLIPDQLLFARRGE
jgi:hypothetical protein